MGFVSAGSVAKMREPSLEDFKGVETWPMPVMRFLAGDYLKRADVVLSRHAGSPFSYFIRKTTGSVFSHSGLVFHVRDQADGYANNFIIEAGTSGVDLTNLRDYCTSPYFIVAIKRFSRPWFGDDVQRFVRGHLLDHIKDDYDYWRVVTLARALLRAYILRDSRPFQQHNRRMRWARIRRGMNANEFICSGLVQYGYFKAIYKLVKLNGRRSAGGEESRTAVEELNNARTRHLLKSDMLKDTLFSSELEAQLDLDESGRFKSFRAARRFWNQMHATVPKDFEESPKLEWLYLIRDGMVYKVSTYEEVKALAKGKIIIPYDETTV
ncbi:MAG: hypothetical protein R3D57_06560 [Hyphomicrobiaceae bacterium]